MRFFRIYLAAIIFLVISMAGRASASVVYYTAVGYGTGFNTYGPNPHGTGGGTADFQPSMSLAYEGAGPVSGTFEYSGSATAAVGVLKTDAKVSLTNYGVGSYYYLTSPAASFTPQMGSAVAQVSDEIQLIGPDPTYDVEFSYHLTGTADWTMSQFRPQIVPIIHLTDSTTFLVDYVGVNPNPGLYDELLTLSISGVPSNTPFVFDQLLQLVLGGADSFYETDIYPYFSGDFDPSHIISQGTYVSTDPYTTTFSADFSHTLKLENVTVRDANGNVVPDAFTSFNGVTYPSGNTPVPEPSTFVLASAGLLGLQIVRRRWLIS